MAEHRVQLNTTVMQDLVGWFMGFADDPEDRQ